MNLYQVLGAALLVLALALPALDKLKIKPFGDAGPWRVAMFRAGMWRLILWDLVTSELGAVNTTYYARGSGILINGSTTNPTTTQGSLLNVVKAVCQFGVTGDAQVLITHNMGLDVSAPTYLDPQVLWEAISVTTYAPLLTFDRTNTNVLKVNKPATDGPTTVLITIRRPSVLGQ